jgi:hypothetical protein
VVLGVVTIGYVFVTLFGDVDSPALSMGLLFLIAYELAHSVRDKRTKK